MKKRGGGFAGGVPGNREGDGAAEADEEGGKNVAEDARRVGVVALLLLPLLVLLTLLLVGLESKEEDEETELDSRLSFAGETPGPSLWAKLACTRDSPSDPCMLAVESVRLVWIGPCICAR